MSTNDRFESSANSPSARVGVSRSLRVAAAWAWRILVILGVLVVFFLALAPVRSAIVATLLALLVAVLLDPLVGWLRKRFHMSNTLSAVIGFFLGIILVVGLFSLAITQLIKYLPTLVTQAVEGLNEFLLWLMDLVLDGETTDVSTFIAELQRDMMTFLRSHSSTIASEAWTLASSAIGLVAAGIVVIFALFFFLKDGRGMWIWLVRMLPEKSRNPVNEAGIRAWVTLSSYVRTQVQVAAIDALGIGLGAYFLGVPLAIPITVLVFFFAFIPIVGAFVTGAVAIFIALVNNGLTTALIMFVIVLAVQQLEGNVLQPILMSHAVSLHPLAVVLVVTVGSMVAGIPGALFSVPILAVLNSSILYLHGHDPMPYLATDESRPGGPPGSLEKQIEDSYRTAAVDSGSKKKRGRKAE